MTANEESKGGVSQIYNYNNDKPEDNISNFSYHKEETEDKYRGPLDDATNTHPFSLGNHFCYLNNYSLFIYPAANPLFPIQ